MICPPVGWEFIRSYRSFRHLAQRLSGAGFHVLRFDYDGTGDSAGSDRDPGRAAAWLGSVGHAIAELRLRAALPSVSLFGARLGATLAATVAAERDDVTSLVAWGPYPTGRAFIRELRAFRQLGRTDGGRGLAEGDQEGGGFLFTAETATALGEIDLARLERAPAPRVLVLARDSASNEDKLADHLRACGAAVDFERLPGYAPMVLNELHDSVVPDEVFTAAVSWLAADPSAGAPRAHEPAAEATVSRAALAGPGGVALQETAALFGPDAHLFGILTEPAAAATPRRPALILLNNGAVHHVGSQRLYVRMAREWAARGHPVLRMDLGGLGDSRPTPGRPENLMYAASVTDDIREAIAWMQGQGAERFLLLGLCAGAYASFHAGLLGKPVVGTILINPQTFYWKEGDSLAAAPSEVYSSLRQYQLSLWKGEKWRKILRGGVSLPHVAGLLASRAKTVILASLASLPRRLGRSAPRGTLAGDLRALVEAGTDVFMVFSAGDPGLDYIDLHARGEMARLQGRENLQVVVIEGPDHTFTPLWSQDALFATLTAHLAERP